MKDRIIEMLERGERVELECIDEEAMIASNKSYADVLLSMPLIVSHIFTNKIVFNNGLFIRENKLKYFKIKEPEYTFNDLIDVVVQAYKDGVIPSLELGSEMGVRSVRCLASAILDEWDDYSNGVNNIKSLYTETFVIESEEDIKRIIEGARVVMTNGVDVTACRRVAHLPTSTLCYQPCEDSHIQYLWIEALKGSTVTQKRGNQCNK